MSILVADAAGTVFRIDRHRETESSSKDEAAAVAPSSSALLPAPNQPLMDDATRAEDIDASRPLPPLTVGELKRLLVSRTGVPVFLQRLYMDSGKKAAAGEEELRELRDDEIVEPEAALKLMPGLDGGCACGPFYIKIKDFQCQFRCACFYSGIDLQWQKCQYCCIHWGCNIQ